MGCIVRIDKPKNSTKGTHGWQARAGGKRGYHSKLFSDNVYGSKGKALVAAEEYLEQYLKEHPEARADPQPNKPFHRGRLMRHNTSGITGVYYTEYAHRWDKERLVGYWCAFIPGGPAGQKRWHKTFNVDRYGEQEAKRLAIEFRKEWEKAVLIGEKAVEEFFEEYYYSRIIDTRFGSEDREEDFESWEEIEEAEVDPEPELEAEAAIV